MSDVVRDAKARPPIDLDEFERQLREMQARPKHHIADPLAELARIVGQDDPFRLAHGMKPASEGRAAAASDEMRHDAVKVEPPVSGPASHFPPRPSYASPLDELAAISAVEGHGEATGPAPDFLSVRRDEPRFGFEPGEEPAAGFEPDNDDVAPKRSRAGLVIFTGLVVFGLAGVGAVWSLSGPRKSVQLSSADIPVIAPKPGPIKEKPADPGGLDVPNQKTAVLEKAKDDFKQPAKALAREEQPVDLSQVAKKDVRRVDVTQAGQGAAPPVAIVTSAPAVPVAVAPPVVSVTAESPVAPKPADSVPKAEVKPDATQPAAAIPSPPAKPTSVGSADPVLSAPSISTPKRVKSIRFNANGEPADQPAPQIATPAPVAPVAPPVVAPVPPPAKPVVAKAATPAPAPPKPAPKAVVLKEVLKEPTPLNSSPPTDAAAPLALSPPAGVSRKAATTPLAAKKATPKAVQTALAPATDEPSDTGATNPLSSSSIAAPTAAPSAASTAGSSPGPRKFAVQFGAPGTTDEANALIGKLKSQYPSVMGQVSPRVIKAELNGKSFFRVRSGALSRDEATQLCSQLKSAGGACFVSGA